MVHLIAGGSDAEQAKEGDFLNKEERYGRLEDYIRILRRAWESPEPFDWDSKYYQFKQFSNRVRLTYGKIAVSVGGSSDEAYRIGGSLGDIFGLWGEPLKETKQQIDRIYAEADKAGRAKVSLFEIFLFTYCEACAYRWPSLPSKSPKDYRLTFKTIQG